MNQLEALNRILRSAGHDNTVDLGDQSMERGNATEALNRARKQILSNGYQFNTDVVDLQPDPAHDNKVKYPTGFLFVGLGERFFHLGRSGNEERRLTFRYTADSDGKQTGFIWDQRERAFVTEEVVDVVRVFDVFDSSEEQQGFDRIPQLCAEWIATLAAAEYFHEVNGVSSATLEKRAEKARTRFINKERFADIHSVTGFRTLEAIGHGGTTSSFDVRTQTRSL